MAIATDTAAAPEVNNRREIFGWMMYDWANSAFSTTTVTVFLGPYLSAIVRQAAGAASYVYLLGIPIAPDSFFAYSVSTSVFLQVFLLPVLGAIADYTNLRKQMLMLFATIGAVAAALLFFLTAETYLLGALCFIIANVTFGASIVFYNAYLPDIASLERRDQVSSWGWGLGYAGGGLLLLLNLLLYQFRNAIGISEPLAVRISLLSAGVWWLGFSQVTFATLRARRARRALPPGESYLGIGFKQLAATFREMRHFPETIRYLVAYLLYNDGIQTVIAMSVTFGAVELGMKSSELILLTLMVQIMAFGGAFFFGWLAGRISAKPALIVSLVIWCGIVIAAWFVHDTTQFWIMAAFVALVMGGSQAISRSLFSKMIPPNKEAEFFSFYEVSERGTSWIGPLLFGLANQFFGSMRYSILSLIVLFVAGLAVLITVNVARAIREAAREPAAA